ncbi:hypothetical protein M569_08052, partial [Genlisea aurea]
VTFDRDRHVDFLLMMYQLLPSDYQDQEINRLTMAYFVVSGLDILQALDRIGRDEAISWVLSLQFKPKDAGASLEDGQFYGFGGSRSLQSWPYDTDKVIYNGSHLASTYCALAILKILGYDMSLIDSESLIKSMKNLQQPGGCFASINAGGEEDLRFLFCAAAICSVLNNWGGMDCQKSKEYIMKCQSYDGGFGLTPCSESHGGATYCAVASLKLMGLFDEALGGSSSATLLLDWCLQKQCEGGGFQGRSNKPADTCYAFWIGSVVRMIVGGGDELIDAEALKGFLSSCETKCGGFSKFPEVWPDLYHSYYGICSLSLMNETGLKPLCFELGI